MVYITLYGHKVVLFGATGGIGKELCREVLALGASLIMAIRNKDKAEALKTSLLKEFEKDNVVGIITDYSKKLGKRNFMLGNFDLAEFLNNGIYWK